MIREELAVRREALRAVSRIMAHQPDLEPVTAARLYSLFYRWQMLSDEQIRSISK